MANKKVKKGEETVREAFVLPESLRERFNRLIKEKMLNKSALLRSLIENWVVENEKPKGRRKR